MYYSTRDKQQFRDSEREGLHASTAYARMAWARAEADGQRLALSGDEQTEARSHAMRERFRVAHREAMAFESDLDEGDEDYRDMDEYGYAA